MHAWVKWTAEAGKGLFVRNDVLLALVQGVLAHVQGAGCVRVLIINRNCNACQACHMIDYGSVAGCVARIEAK